VLAVPRRPADHPADDLRRARFFGSAVFFFNGLVFASLVPRLPEIRTALDLGPAAYGLVVAAMPAGALSLGLLAPRTMARLGTARVATLGMIVLAAVFALVGAAPVAVLFAAGMFLAGGTDAIVDVAQNSHALRLQRLYGRSIITSFHALWSFGSLTGGVLGSVAAGAGLPVAWHMLVIAVLTSLAMLASRGGLLPDDGPATLDTSPGSALPAEGGLATIPVETPRIATGSSDPGRDSRWLDERSEQGGAKQDDRADGPVAGSRRPVRPWAMLAVLGAIGTVGAMVEDGGSNWSGVHLDVTHHLSPGITGLGFVLFTAGMLAARLLADRVIDRFGRRAVVGVGGLGVAVGFALAALWPEPVAAVAGFAIAGVGTAALIPLAMDAADEIVGLAPGVGLTVVSWVLRAGSLLSPVVVGAVAEVTGVGHALLLIAAAGAIVAVCSRALPARRAG
ncbi:MAG: MFS transporter, partial [Actinomycetaceae bacterium]